MARLTGTLSKLSLAAVALLAAAAAAEDPKGNLLLIGGGDRPHAVMAKFVELAGGPSAPIVILPTASGEASTGPRLKREFERGHGCTAVTVANIRIPPDAHRQSFVEAIRNARGIFFSGGDQRRIIQALRETPALSALQEAFAAGAVVGGTSAGTACQSPLMLTGEGNFSLITAGNVEVWPGLGLFPGVIVDQHFVARSRHNRLISVVLEHPHLLGVGVDEATAVWVKPDQTFEVVGEGWVVVYDAAAASVNRQRSDAESERLGVHNLRTHVLLPGEGFDLAVRAAVAPADPVSGSCNQP